MKNIAQLLVEQNVVQTNFENPFTWTSGIKSPVYCDCRELISIPEARDIIVEAFLELMERENLKCDYIAGPATAGIPWAAIIADRLKIPMLYVRSKPKGHGAGKMVEGKVFTQNPNIVVVEDAFSTGGSSIKSAEALRTEVGAMVTHIMGIFSWSTPQSITNAEEADITLAPLTEFHAIVKALIDSGKIDQTQKESLERFHDNPSQWGV
ncbi:orotate phosphoribosyltransferase [bacterium]|nr:orotate phosphoribosyltransferase [bacterium]NCQ55220.1 orotate phosphoribosyltransferase [Candidatus Parcubacteria bacterium]NCS67267.1 orotate phosphoribosyltransferase [Candidatus Peregrinibacteria bacterium]NCS96522.1 orotate phosphoribosyltransferase [bacterium]